MKKTVYLTTLILGLGAAGAQTVPTAGSTITNQAAVSFEYTDPVTQASTSGTSQSNVVSTTVIGVPSYTLTENTADQTVTAGSTVTYTYTLTNTGNTTLAITLAESVGTVSPTTVTLAPGAQQTVTVSYPVANAATGGSTYTHDLTATALSDTAGDGSTDETFGTNVQTAQNITTVYTVTEPTSGSPDTGIITFPTDPTNPGLTPDTTTTDPSDSTGNGYVTDGPGGAGPAPVTGNTPVYVDAGGNQTAYPVADTETATPDTVTLTGSVTNAGPRDDILTVGPATDPDGAGPITVQLVNPATGNPFQTGDAVVDANGNPIPGVVAVVNSDGSVSFVNPGPDGVAGTADDTGIPAGTSPAYDVRIAYPDTESAQAPTAPITTTVPVSSANAGGQQVGDTSFTVKTPGVNISVLNEGLDDLGAPVTPNATATTDVDFTTTVTNNGDYTEVFNVTQAASSDLPAGAAVQYLAADGTVLTDTNGDGIVDTGSLDAGQSVTITTRVILPASAPARTDYVVASTAVGARSGTADTDSATFDVAVVEDGGATTADPTDPNYTSNSNFPVTKTTATTTVAPGGTVEYSVSATNRYNTSVYNVVLQDSLSSGTTNAFTYADLTSVTPAALPAGQFLYGSCNGSYGVTPDYAAINAADALCVAYDANSDGVLSAADTLPTGATIAVNLVFTVPQTPSQQ